MDRSANGGATLGVPQQRGKLALQVLRVSVLDEVAPGLELLFKAAQPLPSGETLG